jgi:hypothetical protein
MVRRTMLRMVQDGYALQVQLITSIAQSAIVSDPFALAT